MQDGIRASTGGVVSKREAPTSVLIVEDHQMFGEALHILLSGLDEISVLPTAADGITAVAAAAAYAPDVVLMDIDLPGMDGIEATRRVLEVSPTSHVVMITALMDPDLFSRSVGAGASGFISKQRAADELVQTVKLAAEGETIFLQRELEGIVSSSPQGSNTQSDGSLSGREREVLQCLAEGLTTREVSSHLFVSPRTIEGHVQSILRKLGARSKLEAVLIGLRERYVFLRTSDTGHPEDR